MPLQPIQLPPGLQRDTTPYDTPDRWYDMDQVRWQSGSVQPIGGWTANVPKLADAIRKMFAWRAPGGPFGMIGTDTKLYTTNEFADITPVGLISLPSIGANGGFGTLKFGRGKFGTRRTAPSPAYSPYAYWSLDNWGSDGLAVNNADGRLWYYDHLAATTPPVVVAEAPTAINGMLVTDERHAMLFGCTIGGTHFPFRVAWCSEEDIHNWDFASLDKTAGFLDIKARSPLLRGVKVREGVLAFSNTDVHLGTYIGLPYIYGFDRIDETVMMHPDSIATFDGKAVWFAKDGFQLYSGGIVQPLPCPILNDILKDMDPIYGPPRVHAGTLGMFPEIWFFWPSVGQTECDRYAIWNYADNWWGWGRMKRSACMVPGVYRKPMMGDATGQVFTHEDGFTAAGASRVGNIWLRSGALGALTSVGDVGQLLLSGGKGYDAISVEFFSKLTPQDENEYLFGPYYTRSDGWTDARVTGRAACIQFSATKDEGWSIGKIQADVALGGSGR